MANTVAESSPPDSNIDALRGLLTTLLCRGLRGHATGAIAVLPPRREDRYGRRIVGSSHHRCFTAKIAKHAKIIAKDIAIFGGPSHRRTEKTQITQV